MLIKDLQKFGFSKNQSTVYLEIIGQEEVKAGEIIRKTGLHRNIVYTALNDLEDKKLVTKIEKRGVARYRPLSPEHILGELEEKENLAKSIIEQIKVIKKPTEREVTIYEGNEGVYEVTSRGLSLKPGETSYVMGAPKTSQTPELVEYWHKYNAKRIEKGINFKIMYDETVEQSTLDKRNELDLTEAKYMPHGFKLPMWVEMAGDETALIVAGETPLAFNIKSKEIAAAFQQYFNYLWNKQTETYRGEEGVEAFMRDTLNYDDVYFIGGNGGLERFHPNVWNWYKHERIKRNVFWHDLIDPGGFLSGSNEGLIHDELNNEPLFEWKILPSNLANPHVICFYGNKVANIIWKEESIINVIEDEDVVKGYKKYFDYLWNEEAQTYTGWKEVKSLFFDKIIPSFKKGETKYVIGAGYGDESINQKVLDFFVEYNNEGIRRGLKKKLLFQKKHEDIVKKERSLLKNATKESFEVKYLPESYYSPVEIHITPKYVVILILTDNPIATVYENDIIRESFKKQFDVLWNQKTETFTGMEGMHRVFNDMLDALEPGEAYNVIGASSHLSRKHIIDFFNEFHIKRIKKGVVVNMLAYKESVDEIKNRTMIKRGDKDLKISHIKPLMTEPLVPVQVQFYKNTVLIGYYYDEPQIIRIEDENLRKGFEAQFNEHWNKKTQILEGHQGIVDLCEMVLREKEDVYLIGATGSIEHTHPKYFKEYSQKRRTLGIQTNMLANENTRGQAFTKLENTNAKFLPPEFASPLVIWIFGDYVANVLWHEPQTVFLTHDKKVAEYYRNYYKALEKIAKK